MKDLQTELQDLYDALDNENNQEMRRDIEDHIVQVKRLIDDRKNGD